MLNNLTTKILLLCCCMTQTWCEDSWCYSADPAPVRDYSSYTPYWYSQGQPEAVNEEIPGCQVKHFYHINRHGTRHPSDSTSDDEWELMPGIRDQIVDNHKQGKGSLCTQDLARLASWEPRIEDNDRSELSSRGWGELREIAERFEVRYPSLLSLGYNDVTRDHFYFRHTDAKRTRHSSRSFAQGLFGYWEGVDMLEVDEEDDILLRFYKNCPKYTEEVENQPNVEKELFIEGPEVANMLTRVEERLGYEEGGLDFDSVLAMYESCRFDFGVYNDAPWCSTLTVEDLEVINYFEDLQSYWEEGYGHEINYEMSCPIIVDIMEHFDAAISGGTSGTSLHFAHSTTCFALTARMGLFDDSVPPLASNFDDRHNRQWDTTSRLPLATNFAFALYECAAPLEANETHKRDVTQSKRNNNINNNSYYYVKFHHHEMETVIPGCSDQLCPYDELTALWRNIVDNCDFEEICAV